MGRMLLVAIPLVVLAACGGAEVANKGKAKADALQPGQYEVTAEVTAFKAADKGVPKIDTKQGTSTTRSVCVTDAAALPTDLFADEGFVCRNAGNMFARGGTLSASLECTRAGLSGAMGYAVSGTFSGDTFEAERQLKTRLSTDGDVEVTATLRGRRTGECTAAPAAGGAEEANDRSCGSYSPARVKPAGARSSRCSAWYMSMTSVVRPGEAVPQSSG